MFITVVLPVRFSAMSMFRQLEKNAGFSERETG
jgi:hypothetical protein